MSIEAKIVGSHPVTGLSTRGHSVQKLEMKEAQELVEKSQEKGFYVVDSETEKPITVDLLEDGQSITIVPPISGG
jgi:molybdopterin converting factor small subunit